jgi:hypothetical protein
MSLFAKENTDLKELDIYSFDKEADLQELLYEHPEIILSVPEIESEINSKDIVIKFREYNVSSCYIDLLLITKYAEIILVETKLIRNPEAVREVVVQIIDYIKALTTDDFEKLLNNCKSNVINNEFIIDYKFVSRLRENICIGNINGIIIGEEIHSNLLGLVEYIIQSAPHLAFHINLVKIEAYNNDNQLLISARNVKNTKEIERSVITISFDGDINNPKIKSKTPTKERKDSKQDLTWDEYISTVDKTYQKMIEDFKNEWINHFGENAVNVGTVGFSVGFYVGEKKTIITSVLACHIRLITEKARQTICVSDNLYNNFYIEEIKKSPKVYSYLKDNSRDVSFCNIDQESLKNIFDATIKFATEFYKELKNKNMV